MSKFRPLLAATIESEDQLGLLQYPLIASPKIDGIRVLIHPEVGPCTRSMTKVANKYIYDTLNVRELQGFDGEIVVGENSGLGVFARTTGAVRSFDGAPDFTYWVFDNFSEPTKPYHIRHTRTYEFPHLRTKVLEHRRVTKPEDVLNYERECLERGFEGIMLRHPQGIYKFNRSTFSQQILLKLKRFEDGEARIVGFEELLRNQNEAQKNALGLTDRGSHKAGMVAAGTLGALKVWHPTFGDFSIGSGFDSALRLEIWQNQTAYNGKLVTFKYQKVGIQEKPRFPIFKGIRDRGT